MEAMTLSGKKTLRQKIEEDTFLYEEDGFILHRNVSKAFREEGILNFYVGKNIKYRRALFVIDQVYKAGYTIRQLERAALAHIIHEHLFRNEIKFKGTSTQLATFLKLLSSRGLP